MKPLFTSLVAVGRSAVRICVALVLVGSGASAIPALAAAPAGSAPGPAVYLTPPAISAGHPLGLSSNNVTFTATATAATGQAISEVDLQESSAGTNSWQTIACSTTSPSGGYSASNPALQCTGTEVGSQYQLLYTSQLPDGSTSPDGIYDFRAAAINGSGQNVATSAVAPDLSVVNDSSYVWLANPGSPLSSHVRSVDLNAEVASGNFTPDTITYWICRTADSCPANPPNWTTSSWTKLATRPVQIDSSGNADTDYQLDTTGLADGEYDIAVTAGDAAGDPFTGTIITHVLIDNTAPSVTLANPGSSLGGVVSLNASASDSGSGLDSVIFQAAPAGTSQWTTVGEAGSPPYSVSFDTRQLSDGSYDIRAQAIDNAGNEATSMVSGVAIANSGAQSFGGLVLTDYSAPATNIQLLGELPGDQHETWAVGQTDAPPPTIDGTPLPYTAEGNGQLVLLRYTDASGWQIVDVLRNADGSPFPIYPGASIQVDGQMTASGEAWLCLYETFPGLPKRVGVFHRRPGGEFLYDAAATSALYDNGNGLLAVGVSSTTMHLAQTADGTAYGVLVQTAGTPPTPVPNVPAQSGPPVTVNTQLEYGQLSGGAWSVPSPQLPASYTAPPGVNSIKLDAADVTSPGSGWMALTEGGPSGGPMILARFDQNGLAFMPQTGLDALDLTGPFASGSPDSEANGGAPIVQPTALRADAHGVWIGANVRSASGQSLGTAVARYDDTSGGVVDSWCTHSLQSFGCAGPLDPPDQPAAVPDAEFDTSQGIVAEALASDQNDDFVDVYYDDAWTPVATPGINNYPVRPGRSVFADPTDGWIVGANSLARISATPPPSPLASWPAATRNPLLSVALPPGQSTTDTAGALAVGLNGTALHYEPSAGWQVDATPPQAQHIELTGVAFAGPALAFAVGQGGTILRWNGSNWSPDPQSLKLTNATLNAVAFASDGQGWAVGARGTILHYDGTAWSSEEIDSEDSGTDLTSVTVAGGDVYALASGNLIMRSPAGSWRRVPVSSLPDPTPPVGSLKLVSGLPDGGLAVAGTSLLMIRQSATGNFEYAPEAFQGIPVALAAFRDSTGALRTFISVAPPITTVDGTLTTGTGPFPSGDGDLLLQTNGGFEDLSHDLPPAELSSAPGDGFVQPDPVLAVAAAPDGAHAWAVGGYSGTHAADGIGTDQILSARGTGWFTSAIWRYDAGGSAASPLSTQATVNLPATPDTVNFAFFSSALCKLSCSQAQDAQPDVNLNTAATQIAAFAQQPGGPAFAMVGGNVQGSMTAGTGSDPFDLAKVPQLLSPLSGVPTYAAFGPLDSVPGESDPDLPWAQAFTGAPAPFGSGAAPAGITPQGSGDPTGNVNKYYAFDVTQNGGTLRVIVLDNSAGSLEASAPGQSAWLAGQLGQAQAASLPIVVFAAEPLNVNDPGHASDADAVAAQLAAAGVVAVFTTSGGELNGWENQPDQVTQVPADAAAGSPQIPEYEGATLTYQQPKNNGVLWYDVSVNATTDAVTVAGIPVISSLALDPLDGLIASRSSTLSFEAIGRRPASTIATTPFDSSFPGYSQYVGIPASTCSGCIAPTYTFKSSNPVVGNFVAPTASGSSYPKLTPEGKTTPSSQSGLFCAFNSGTTTVTVTAGLMSASLPVTVKAGAFGPPCGTVPGGVDTNVITLNGGTVYARGAAPQGASPIQPGVTPAHTVLPKLSITPHAPGVGSPAPGKTSPAPTTSSAPVVPQATVAPFVAAPPAFNFTGVAIAPPIPPPLTPVPPGGATVPAQSTAKREERARKHASQSAYVIRPAGESGDAWFYPAVGVVTLVSLLLIGGGIKPGPRRAPAYAVARETIEPRRRHD